MIYIDSIYTLLCSLLSERCISGPVQFPHLLDKTGQNKTTIYFTASMVDPNTKPSKIKNLLKYILKMIFLTEAVKSEK